MQEAPRRAKLNSLPLHDITQQFSEIGLLQRLHHEIDRQDWPDRARYLVDLAESMALEIHSEDKRGKHPYSTHPLRTTIRIASEDHFGIRDPSLLIASLLHDTVEDHADSYRAIVPPPSNNIDDKDNIDDKEHALYVIQELFGEPVARIVRAVTGPEWPEGIPREEKNALYQSHIRDVLHSDKESGIIKLSDFIDNFSGQAYNEDPDLAKRLTQKYLPLVPDFKEFVEDSTIIPGDRKDYILKQLDRAKNRGLELQAV